MLDLFYVFSSLLLNILPADIKETPKEILNLPQTIGLGLGGGVTISVLISELVKYFTSKTKILVSDIKFMKIEISEIKQYIINNPLSKDENDNKYVKDILEIVKQPFEETGRPKIFMSIDTYQQQKHTNIQLENMNGNLKDLFNFLKHNQENAQKREESLHKMMESQFGNMKDTVKNNTEAMTSLHNIALNMLREK